MKLFAALDFEQDTIDALKRFERKLLEYHTYQEYNFESSEKYHLTLRYIGETKDVETTIAQFSEIRHEKFALCLSYASLFRDADSGVLWVGVEGETGQLRRLKEKVDKTLLLSGCEPDHTEFEPHITMAYVDNQLLPKEADLAKLRPEKVSFEVERFHLFSVKNRYTTAVFQKLATFNFT